MVHGEATRGWLRSGVAKGDGGQGGAQGEDITVIKQVQKWGTLEGAKRVPL